MKKGILKDFSFSKDEKHSTFYKDKMIYQIKIGNLGYLNCLSERDVLYNFLTQRKN